MLLRYALSRYAPVEVEAWRFATDEAGRPRVSEPSAVRVPHFSVTHSTGLVACATGFVEQLGIDVEGAGAEESAMRVADRVLSSAELADVRAVPEDHRQERFLEHWTVKEAFLKAKGVGISRSLRSMTVSLGPPAIRVQLEPGPQEDLERWQFELLRPSPHHILAVASERAPDARPTRSVARRVLPLAPG